MHSHKSSGTVHRPTTLQYSVGPMPGTSKQRTAAVRPPAAAAIRQTVTRNTDLRSHVFIRLPPKYAFLCPKGTPPPAWRCQERIRDVSKPAWCFLGHMEKLL